MTPMNSEEGYDHRLGFVTCASDSACLNKYLLASDCLRQKKYYQAVYFDASSAAAAFNAEMEKLPQFEWLVWVHQDVFLPDNWDKLFIEKISEAMTMFPCLAVVGVYGVDNFGSSPILAGNVLDRGQKLSKPAPLPCRVNSLDEMLIAVRTDSGLRFDPNLGFDFYATDIALVANQKGFATVVVDAYCEHWSTTPRDKNKKHIIDRVTASAEVFEHKWEQQLPIQTPCFSIKTIGDVARQCRYL